MAENRWGALSPCLSFVSQCLVSPLSLLQVPVRRVLSCVVANQGRDTDAPVQGRLVEDTLVWLIVMRSVIIGLARQDSAHVAIDQTATAITLSLSTFNDQSCHKHDSESQRDFFEPAGNRGIGIAGALLLLSPN